MEEKKVPKLRFKGFVQEWEQRKLGEVVKINGRIGFRGYTQADIIRKEDGGILAFSPTNIINNKLDFNVKNTYITKDKYYESPEIMVKNGDILFVKTGSTLGKSASVSNLNEEATINPQIVILRATSYFISEFISSYLISNNILKQVAQTRIGGAVPTLTETEIKRFQISAPKGKEQQKIGTLFKQLDDTIALHQRKIEQLKLLKQAFLQKMLANQENVPELRFADFDVYWEQHTLGETTDIGTGRDYKHLKSGNIPVYGTGGYMLSVDDALSFDKDAIGIGRKGTIDNPYILKAPFWTVDTLFYVIPRNGNEIDFFYSVFQKINWKSKDESTGVPSLSKSTINSILVYAPSKDEQKKIGAFFKYFDENILIHQHKVNLLKQLKKAFLQKMFI